MEYPQRSSVFKISFRSLQTRFKGCAISELCHNLHLRHNHNRDTVASLLDQILQDVQIALYLQALGGETFSSNATTVDNVPGPEIKSSMGQSSMGETLRQTIRRCSTTCHVCQVLSKKLARCIHVSRVYIKKKAKYE